MEDLEIKQKCLTLLKKHFGYDSFRENQLEIITSVLKGRDTLAIMPTGGGKSICYQIPSFIFKGLTVVVSPLISLMQDQVSSLKENGINAVFLNSSQKTSEYFSTIEELKKGSVKLLFLSPEGLGTERVQETLLSCKEGVSLFAIDEAHCISSWGHDFRPDYTRLHTLRSLFPKSVWLSLTATATEQVRNDIIANLRMKNPEIFISSFNRKNLYIEVRPRKDSISQISAYLNEHKDESGIIYCLSRKSVDTLCTTLQNKGYSVLPYHAGLRDEVRALYQDSFIKDKTKIIVATVAFGMGINKPNVRFVIHNDLPKSLEEYYQEIGRAGRDGLASSTLLLYSPQDAMRIRYFFRDYSEETRISKERLLRGMLNFASSSRCRRRNILQYFGETLKDYDKDNCCDICSKGHIAPMDVTIPCQKFMSCILRTGSNFGAAYLINILQGSREQRILDNRHNTISTYGIGKDISKDCWFNIVSALQDEGYIETYGQYNVLHLTDKGHQALMSRSPIKLPVNITQGRVLNADTKKTFPSAVVHKTKTFIQSLNEEDFNLYQAIKEWRGSMAEEDNVPPYMIFGDKTIEDLVTNKPSNKEELLKCYGIGEKKAKDYCKDLIGIIQGTQ